MTRYQHLPWQTWPLVSEHRSLEMMVMAAIRAGRMLHTAFYSDYESHVKADQSEHTPFDIQAEKIAAKIVHRFDPDIKVIGEELSPKVTLAELQNVKVVAFDGIDGTTNFSRRIPLCNFTGNLSLPNEAGEPELSVGVVYDFLHGELYYALKGHGSYCNGERISVNTSRAFTESLITFAPLLDVRKGKGENEGRAVAALWGGMRAISQQSRRFHREFQSGGQELSWVACGRLDGYASSWTNPWDLGAGVLIVREAGGKATDIYGLDWQPSFEGVIAGSPQIHKEMVWIFQRYL